MIYICELVINLKHVRTHVLHWLNLFSLKSVHSQIVHVYRSALYCCLPKFATSWTFLPPANVVCEGYVFTRVCYSFCSQGGSTWPGIPPPPRPGATPPGPGTPPRPGAPLDQVNPSSDQVYPPKTRYTPTPPDQLHPWPGTPPLRDQVHPPGPGTPPDQVHTPGTGTPPRPGTPSPDQVHLPDQVHPSGPGTPPSGQGTPPRAEHAGRYGQRGGGPHHTGMQSCLIFILTSRRRDSGLLRRGTYLTGSARLLFCQLSWEIA